VDISYERRRIAGRILGVQCPICHLPYNSLLISRIRPVGSDNRFGAAPYLVAVEP
jgi:hypothetical protein